MSESSREAGVRVLICDDAPAMRLLLTVIVELADGLSVVGEAGDGVAAISQAALLQPDVILLDLSMPKLTGLEALPEIKRLAPAAKIVVLSGFAEPSIRPEPGTSGVFRYLQKGVEPDVILAAIEAAAAEKGSLLDSSRVKAQRR